MEAMEKVKKIKENLAELNLAERDLFDLAYGLDFLSHVARLCEEALDADQDRKSDLSFLAQKVWSSFSCILDILFSHVQSLAERVQTNRFALEEFLKANQTEEV